MKSYPQYEEALGVMSQPHRLTQRTGQRMENLGLGRVRRGAALWCSLHSPREAAPGVGRELAQRAAYPTKVPLVWERHWISRALTIGPWVVQGSWSVRALLLADSWLSLLPTCPVR